MTTRQQLMAGSVAALLDRVAAGRYPPADGGVTILPQPGRRDAGVLSFTAHAVIFVDTEPSWIADQLPAGDLSAPISPAFLQVLCGRTGRQARTIDLLCLAASLPGPPATRLTPTDLAGHARVARALRYRDEVRVWQAAGGIVLIGRGVAGRFEVAVEVDPRHRGRGLGRELATAARHLVPDGAPLWAQIASGNAASVRAFLAAGYLPVGAEALLSLSPLGA